MMKQKNSKKTRFYRRILFAKISQGHFLFCVCLDLFDQNLPRFAITRVDVPHKHASALHHKKKSVCRDGSRFVISTFDYDTAVWFNGVVVVQRPCPSTLSLVPPLVLRHFCFYPVPCPVIIRGFRNADCEVVNINSQNSVMKFSRPAWYYLSDDDDPSYLLCKAAQGRTLRRL